MLRVWVAVLGAVTLLAGSANSYSIGRTISNAGSAGITVQPNGKPISDINRYINYVRALAPVAHWGMGSSVGTQEPEMTGAHTGTWQGAPEKNAGLLWGYGKIKATTSAGTNACQVTNAAALNFTTGMTISVWLTGESQLDQCILGNYNAVFSQGYGMWVVGGTGKAELLVYSDAGALDVKGATVISGSWNLIHLVGTYTPTKATIYVNGAEDAYTEDLSTTLVPSADDLWIGKEAISPTWFTGYFQEVTLWNRALSVKEIANLNSLGRSVLQ